jgi:4-aminobutyrate aminotransferase/(S)-3-amino-2-methylpropionate transaminase
MGPAIPGTAPVWGLILARGDGSTVWDVEGNRYVDLAAGFGSLLLGHSHPEVISALKSQADVLLQAMGDLFSSDLRIELAEAICAHVPLHEPQLIFGQSGADAISSALKTAMLHTGRCEFIACRGAYHGLSFGPLASCGLRESYRAPFQSALATTHFVEYPDRDAKHILLETERLLSEHKIAAFVLEPILGRGGVRRCEPDTIKELHQLCARYGALLILDEIWTGLGRCGAWFATPKVETNNSTDRALACDMVCLGKGLGGGVPISACVAPKSIMASWSRAAEVVDTTTFAAAPLACATALATFKVLTRDALPERAQRLGAAAVSSLSNMLGDLPVQIRGYGLMLALDLGKQAGAAVEVLRRSLDRGVLVSTGGGQREVVVLTPALTIDKDVLSFALGELADCVREVY